MKQKLVHQCFNYRLNDVTRDTRHNKKHWYMQRTGFYSKNLEPPVSILNSKKKHEQRLAKRSRHTRVYQEKIP